MSAFDPSHNPDTTDENPLNLGYPGEPGVQIKSVSAAPPGWWAVYQDAELEGFEYAPVAAWVVIQGRSTHEDATSLVGMIPTVDGGLDAAEDDPRFVRFVFDPSLELDGDLGP